MIFKAEIDPELAVKLKALSPSSMCSLSLSEVEMDRDSYGVEMANSRSENKQKRLGKWI